MNDEFVKIFHDKLRTPLRHISLRNCTISDDGMKMLLNHELVSLSLWYCEKITNASWKSLLDNSKNLEYLELGRYVNMLKSSNKDEPATPIYFQLDLPRIKKLILNGVTLQSSVEFPHLYDLNYLDLTACTFHNDFTLESIVDLPNLTTLILFDVWPLEPILPIICRMNDLQTLDISTSNSADCGTFRNPNEVKCWQNALINSNKILIWLFRITDISIDN